MTRFTNPRILTATAFASLALASCAVGPKAPDATLPPSASGAFIGASSPNGNATGVWAYNDGNGDNLITNNGTIDVYAGGSYGDAVGVWAIGSGDGLVSVNNNGAIVVEADGNSGNAIGIYAEAETTVTGNTVYSVVGTGIRAGNGRFLRNVVIADNVLSAVNTGIGVSVVEAAGPVAITGNIITALEHAIVGMEWEEVVSTDLARDAVRYAHVSISGNRAGA